MSGRISIPLTIKFNAANLDQASTTEEIKSHACMTLHNVLGWIRSDNPNSILQRSKASFRYLDGKLDPSWTGEANFVFEGIIPRSESYQSLKGRVIAEITAQRDIYLMGIMCRWTRSQHEAGRVALPSSRRDLTIEGRS